MSQKPTTPRATTAGASPAAPAPPVGSPSYGVPDFSTRDCEVFMIQDGSAEITVQVDADIMRRIKTRAGTQNLAEYIWLNIFRPALNSHVY